MGVQVGTTSLEDSELVSRMLTQHNIPHSLLNARPKYAAVEAQVRAASPKDLHASLMHHTFHSFLRQCQRVLRRHLGLSPQRIGECSAQ